MSKQQREAAAEYPSGQTFLCCPCFIRKRTPSHTAFNEIPDRNEPYDYVVEKLAIRRVPLSLFATAEDLEKPSLYSAAANPLVINQMTRQAVTNTLPIAETKSSVTFSSYKVAPRPDLEHMSHSNHELRSSLTYLEANAPETELLTVNANQPKKTKKFLTDDQEQLLVSQILNKHSSLYTLDAKEAVPKDPDTNPNKEVVIPEGVQVALAKQQHQQQLLFNRNKIQVEVHKAAVTQTSSPPKKSMTVELQQTINALGFAQKPHIPGVPPKNQKSMPPTVSAGSTEKEICSHVLAIKDILLDSATSYELTCKDLENLNKTAETKKKYFVNKQRPKHSFESRFTRNQMAQYDVVDHDDKSILAVSDMTSNAASTMDLRATRHSMGQQFAVEQGDKACMTPSSSIMDEVELLPPIDSHATDFLTNNSDQCTEISQIKGQNLKWKIIIKHHSDKNKSEEQPTSTGAADSESDLENENFVSGARNLPHT